MIKHDFLIYLMKECVHIHPLINDIHARSNYLLIEHTLSQVKVTSQSLILAHVYDYMTITVHFGYLLGLDFMR